MRVDAIISEYGITFAKKVSNTRLHKLAVHVKAECDCMIKHSLTKILSNLIGSVHHVNFTKQIHKLTK